ncbi:MAG TPA: hypothetical protein VFX70_09975 [Mycobacteriales bacterium]|nr:hypothetical protein [Mycobacteriales bacterium]
MPEPGGTVPSPRPVRLAALVAAVEGLALVGLAAFFLVELAVSTPTDTGAALTGAGFELLGGVLLLMVARGLHQARRWSRSPSVVLQVVSLPVGYTLAFQAGQPWWGLPVLVLAVAELYFLFTPEARRAFDEQFGRS